VLGILAIDHHLIKQYSIFQIPGKFPSNSEAETDGYVDIKNLSPREKSSLLILHFIVLAPVVSVVLLAFFLFAFFRGS